jgi:hypothetical protein
VYLTLPTVVTALEVVHLVPCFTAAAFAVVIDERISPAARTTGAIFLNFLNVINMIDPS